MPLSEQEQRLLEEMERNLYQNDADFVATVGGTRGKPTLRVVVIGILVGLVGVAALLTGVVIHQPLVGVLGFVVMFAGVLLAFAPPRSLRVGSEKPRSTSSPRRKSGSFMDGVNQRWDRRSDDKDS